MGVGPVNNIVAKVTGLTKSLSVLPSLLGSTSTLTSTKSAHASDSFLDAIASRRSYYDILPTSSLADERIRDILFKTLNTVPSSFNSQSTRLVLLLRADHERLWDMTLESLEFLGKANDATRQKIAAFRNGYGTVLFYEDMDVIRGMQEKYSAYADKFEPWGVQTNGMHQLVVWTALEKEGLGANLQHYSPLIDEKIYKEWNVERSWKLNAQLVFGTPKSHPEAKGKQLPESKMRIFGSLVEGVNI